MKTPKQIIEELLSKGFTQSEIAEGSHLNHSAVSRVLSGTQKDVMYTNGKLMEMLNLKFKHKRK